MAFSNNKHKAQNIKKYKLLTQNSKHVNTKLVSKIPQTTKVAAWIKADTGIGPSIASGSHMCNPNCVDFVEAHKIIVIIK